MTTKQRKKENTSHWYTVLRHRKLEILYQFIVAHTHVVRLQTRTSEQARSKSTKSTPSENLEAETAFQDFTQAFEEIRTEDPFMDPLYPPRYIGPQARKRQFEEREEVEAGDAHKTLRRGKAAATAPNPSKAKDADVPLIPPSNQQLWRFPCNAPRPFSPDSYRSVGSSSTQVRFIGNVGVLPTAHQLSLGSSMSPLGPGAEPYKYDRPILPLNLGIVIVNCLGETRHCWHGHWFLVDHCACGGPRSKQAAQQFCLWTRLLRLEASTIRHLIQEISGADRLRDYVSQNFVDGG
ncbi:hypothetical protein EDB83DRAFT_2608758 [Lactarius deliciosus]|nr:hypothetical protein EDB83DRAFT_2608758 [Lactarius deliciosus]